MRHGKVTILVEKGELAVPYSDNRDTGTDRFTLMMGGGGRRE